MSRSTFYRLVMAVIVVCGLSGVTPATADQILAAPVIRGLVKTQSDVVVNSSSPKTGVAKCPPGKKIVGGGGWVLEQTNTAPNRLTLTQLEPSDNVDGSGTDGYIASAAETSPGVSGSWWVQAYAMCADTSSVPGWNIARQFTATTSADRQEMSVGCDQAGQQVVGTGARIGVAAGSEGQVVLQIARVSDPPGLVRAQSHEDADGFAGTHWLGAYAICMTTPQGHEVVTGLSAQRGSESEKSATKNCPAGKQMLSAGAAITNVAPGNVSLQVVFPASVVSNRVDAWAVENTPTSVSWDFIIARGICADKP